MPPVGIGEVMRAGGVGRVVASRHPEFSVGDHVSGMFGVQEYAISDGRGVIRVSPETAPLPQYLSVLGMPGMTAYFGLLEVGHPVAGETVVVSAAAGAVGQLVGQIAKIKGCRVVGIAGGTEKCRFIVDELGFDAAVDYKSEDVRAALARALPGSRGRVLRQCRRRDSRHRADASRTPRAHRHLRIDLAVQQRGAVARTRRTT